MRKRDLGDIFDDIYFKPEGISSDESKYWALKGLWNRGSRNLFHYDDNAQTVRRLAEALPDINFIIVQDLTSGFLFSRKEMKKYPNVARIALRKRGQIEEIQVPFPMGTLPHAITA